jgi:hypothetical protein
LPYGWFRRLKRSPSFRAEILFDFAARNRRLPAGEYQIKPATPGVLLIQSNDAYFAALANQHSIGMLGQQL